MFWNALMELEIFKNLLGTMCIFVNAVAAAAIVLNSTKILLNENSWENNISAHTSVKRLWTARSYFA